MHKVPTMVHRVMVFGRFLILRAQLAYVRKAMHTLPLERRRLLARLTLREHERAATSPQPELYGSTRDFDYRPWGNGTALAFQRLRSNNPQLALRGIALWLAVAYHETRLSQTPELQGLHRSMMALFRELRALASAVPTRTVVEDAVLDAGLRGAA